MAASLKTSTQGLAKIEQARNEKGWTTEDPEACRQASKILVPDVDWYSEENIAESLFANGASISTWKRFLEGKEPINVPAFKAFCQTLELDYLEICQGGSASYYLVLSSNIDEVQKSKIEAILEHLCKLLDDPTITLKEIKPGSVVLVLEGSLEGFEKLQTLYRNGQLREILGYHIEDVQLESVEPVDIRQWLENLFSDDWQPGETLLNLQTVRSRVTDTEFQQESITKAKAINLGEGRSVILLVKFIPKSE